MKVLRCKSCTVHFRAEESKRTVGIHKDHFEDIDLTSYAHSVRVTREASFGGLVRRVKKYVPRGKWLDVGCSFGWLLQYLQGTDFLGIGIDPSHSAVVWARKVGLNVFEGLYPQDLTLVHAPFDVVSFIDALEHLSDPVDVLAKTRELLNPGGVALVQVPDQSCLLYKLSRILVLASSGSIDFAMRRLWLTDLDFPHLFYFNVNSLTRLFEDNGFRILELYRAPISSPKLAIDRVRYLRKSNPTYVNVFIGALVAVVNLLDSLSGYGGLIVCIAAKAGPGVPVREGMLN